MVKIRTSEVERVQDPPRRNLNGLEITLKVCMQMRAKKELDSKSGYLLLQLVALLLTVAPAVAPAVSGGRAVSARRQRRRQRRARPGDEPVA